jgi:predicted nucleotidyltransferase
MKAEIIGILSQTLSQKNEILFAYLHGSFLESKTFQDIDVAVYLEETTKHDINIIEYEIALSLLVEKQLRMAADVKALNWAPLSFRYNVSRGLLLLSRDELKREDFLCATWMEYFDFLPISKAYVREVLSA